MEYLLTEGCQMPVQFVSTLVPRLRNASTVRPKRDVNVLCLRRENRADCTQASGRVGSRQHAIPRFMAFSRAGSSQFPEPGTDPSSHAPPSYQAVSCCVHSGGRGCEQDELLGWEPDFRTMEELVVPQIRAAFARSAFGSRCFPAHPLSLWRPARTPRRPLTERKKGIARRKICGETTTIGWRAERRKCESVIQDPPPFRSPANDCGSCFLIE